MKKEISDEKQLGHISLFRSIRKHWIWSDPQRFQWWVDILLEANHKEKKVLIGSELITCKRGECVVSVMSWAKRWRVNRGTVRRFFELLQSDSMIVLKPTNKTTHLTICNYDSYQSYRPSKTPSKGHQSDIKCDTTNNDNNDNNVYRGKTPPTILEVKEYFKVNGYTEKAAEKAFKYYNDAGWVDSKGNRVRNWKQKMQGVWFKDENKIPAVVGMNDYLKQREDDERKFKEKFGA
jgi:hypothetical protein